MPRYFFDLNDGEWARDEEGSECANTAQAIALAKRTLPEMALDHLPHSGDCHTLTMLVTDEDARPVYTATLSFNGLAHDR